MYQPSKFTYTPSIKRMWCLKIWTGVLLYYIMLEIQIPTTANAGSNRQEARPKNATTTVAHILQAEAHRHHNTASSSTTNNDTIHFLHGWSSTTSTKFRILTAPPFHFNPQANGGHTTTAKQYIHRAEPQWRQTLVNRRAMCTKGRDIIS